MGEPIRVLQVLATLDRGGAEAMIMNLYRSMDHDKIQFDFVVNESDREYAHEAEIRRLGGRIYHLPDYKIINYFSYKRAWHKLLGEHPEWRIIHGHHITPAAVYMKVAKQHNRITIAHSHSTKGVFSVKNLIKFLLRLPMKRQVDYPVACSRSSSDWMFGKNNSKVMLIRNAIDIKKYEYHERTRQRMREQFSLSDKFVIGHIGNFTKAKNYPFLLNVFQTVKARNENAVLVLVGKKENNPRIEELINRMGLRNSVILTGIRSDIPELLQMMDLFLFPSLYEGLPVTLIEAQASGLRCIVSDRITEEVKLTDRIEFLSLRNSAKDWGERILHETEIFERVSDLERITGAGYDVSREGKVLEKFYQDLKVYEH
ncbi:MAG: glycosyltransferase family 1 protein [Herbinix sp.]|jgi:glycosyltransferase involved in cell wall biosynthesis|nr:glycosyltransferase family 1 protein [Herbinix sp.]